MKIITIICDVMGCKRECSEYNEALCSHGWITQDYNSKKYKKMENMSKPIKTHLCSNHYKDYCILTCKLLKMDKEVFDG